MDEKYYYLWEITTFQIKYNNRTSPTWYFINFGILVGLKLVYPPPSLFRLFSGLKLFFTLWIFLWLSFGYDDFHLCHQQGLLKVKQSAWWRSLKVMNQANTIPDLSLLIGRDTYLDQSEGSGQGQPEVSWGEWICWLQIVRQRSRWWSRVVWWCETRATSSEWRWRSDLTDCFLTSFTL